MANSMATLSRRLYHSLHLSSNPKISQISMPFCTTTSTSTNNNLLFSNEAEDSDSNADDSLLGSDTDSVPNSTTPFSSTTAAATTTAGSSPQRELFDSPLQNGLDVGIYKAILVGKVGQSPLLKRLRSGKEVTLFSLGTGGIRNNRRPLRNEDPKEYANRCAVQWHRVSVYPDRLARIVMQNVTPG